MTRLHWSKDGLDQTGDSGDDREQGTDWASNLGHTSTELGDEKLRIKDFQLGKMSGWWSLLLRK